MIDKSGLMHGGVGTDQLLHEQSWVFDLEPKLAKRPYGHHNLVDRVFQLQRRRRAELQVQRDRPIDEPDFRCER